MNITRKKGPLYLQIKNILKDRILHGVYAVDTNIPTEPQLEKEFNVSKITVRNAIKELVQEGFLETRSGKGTKVIRNTSIAALFKGKRLTEILVEEGHTIHKELISAELISNPKESELYQLFGENSHCIQRLFRIDGKPFTQYTHYLSPHIQVDATAINQRSLYDFIEEQNIRLEKFRDEFAVSLASKEVADLLNIREGSPLLQRFRYTYDESNRLIEYSEGLYNTELKRYISSS